MAADSVVFTVAAGQAGRRLDLFVAEAVEALSRTQAKRAIEAGDVTVDGGPARPRDRVTVGQTVAVRLPEPEPSSIAPESIALDIRYEDHDLVVVNKPAGMVTHPARGHWGGTLVNALLAHCDDLSGIGGELRPGIVHRLDAETSGLLVVAKHDRAHRALAEQLAQRIMSRRYLAVVYGDPEFDERWIDAPIGRHPVRRVEQAVVDQGRPARTHASCVERFGYAAVIAAKLDTGRTHQVRVHLTHLGHPLFGDRVYGLRRQRQFQPLPDPVAAAEAALPGQALHAARLSFNHPLSGAPLAFEAPPPPAMRTLLTALRSAAGRPSADAESASA